MFLGPIWKQDGCPGFWLAETFSTSLKPPNRIQTWQKADISTSSVAAKFVFFRPIEKTRWPSRPLIGWDIFDFSSETAEQNSTKLDRNQDLNILYQVCVFTAYKKTRWPPWPLIGWDISTSPLKPLNGIQRNLTGSKISTSSTKFVFFWPLKNKMAALASDLLRHFRLTFKLMNGIQRNLTGSKISTSSTKYVLFGPISKLKNNGRFLKKVAHCTQVKDMWPFGPLVLSHRPRKLGQYMQTILSSTLARSFVRIIY